MEARKAALLHEASDGSRTQHPLNLTYETESTGSSLNVHLAATEGTGAEIAGKQDFL